jgi:hypothetical protein
LTTRVLRRSSAPDGRHSQKRSATTGSPFNYGDRRTDPRGSVEILNW